MMHSGDEAGVVAVVVVLATFLATRLLGAIRGDVFRGD